MTGTFGCSGGENSKAESFCIPLSAKRLSWLLATSVLHRVVVFQLYSIAPLLSQTNQLS